MIMQPRWRFESNVAELSQTQTEIKSGPKKEAQALGYIVQLIVEAERRYFSVLKRLGFVVSSLVLCFIYKGNQRERYSSTHKNHAAFPF